MITFNRQKKQEESISKASNIISGETTLEGDITTSGNISIEGTVFGNLKTEAKVVVSQSAFIEGHVVAQEVIVAGEVKGSIEVAGLLILKSTSYVQGDIIANDLIIEEGAVLHGRCCMGITIKDFQIEKGWEVTKMDKLEKNQKNQEKTSKSYGFQQELISF